MKALLTILLFFCLTTGVDAQQMLWNYDPDENVPYVYEEYDTVHFSRMFNDDRIDVVKVYFFRDGKLIADRLYQEDWNTWLIYAEGDSIYITFNDYSNANRVVKCKSIDLYTFQYEPDNSNDGGQWWAQGRRMADLKQPQEQIDGIEFFEYWMDCDEKLLREMAMRT